MALVPVKMSHMGVGVTVNVKTSLSHVSYVSSRTVEPSDLLKRLLSEWSDDGSKVEVVPVSATLLD